MPANCSISAGPDRSGQADEHRVARPFRQFPVPGDVRVRGVRHGGSRRRWLPWCGRGAAPPAGPPRPGRRRRSARPARWSAVRPGRGRPRRRGPGTPRACGPASAVERQIAAVRQGRRDPQGPPLATPADQDRDPPRPRVAGRLREPAVRLRARAPERAEHPDGLGQCVESASGGWELGRPQRGARQPVGRVLPGEPAGAEPAEHPARVPSRPGWPASWPAVAPTGTSPG